MKFLIIPLFIAFSLTGCNKEAGRGGTSSILGKLHVYDINGIGDTIGEYDAMDEDIFVIYGESDETYDDKTSCSYDGSFRFDYLSPGKYKIFAYSRCDICDDGVTPVFKTIEVTDKKTEYSVSNFNILK